MTLTAINTLENVTVPAGAESVSVSFHTRRYKDLLEHAEQLRLAGIDSSMLHLPDEARATSSHLQWVQAGTRCSLNFSHPADRRVWLHTGEPRHGR